MKYADQIAEALLETHAVGFSLDQPIVFKSGIKSPVYVDNRTLPFYPQLWNIVIKGFADLIKKNGLEFDVIAGIETAGIPHSAGLGSYLQQPSVFVRKAVKDHGTKKMVEGGSVKNAGVLLIEDHVTTGLSSLTGVKSLRQEGAVVNDCLAITSYEFAEANENFNHEHVNLHTLTSFAHILKHATDKHMLKNKQVKVVEEWLADPHGWAAKYGF